MPRRNSRTRSAGATARRAIITAAKRELGRREAALPELARLDGEVAAAAIRTFQSPSPAVEWLIRPAFALNGEVPLALLRRPSGREAVLQALWRIDFDILG